MDYKTAHVHQIIHNKIVRSVLRRIAKESEVPYPLVHEDFTAGREEITRYFWDVLNEDYPDTFSNVYFCQGCRKFSLIENSERVVAT